MGHVFRCAQIVPRDGRDDQSDTVELSAPTWARAGAPHQLEVFRGCPGSGRVETQRHYRSPGRNVVPQESRSVNRMRRSLLHRS